MMNENNGNEKPAADQPGAASEEDQRLEILTDELFGLIEGADKMMREKKQSILLTLNNDKGEPVLYASISELDGHWGANLEARKDQYPGPDLEDAREDVVSAALALMGWFIGPGPGEEDEAEEES